MPAPSRPMEDMLRAAKKTLVEVRGFVEAGEMTLAEALNALDSAADGNCWMITKGCVLAGEPMYVAAVYLPGSAAEDPLAISEGDDLPAVIHDVALKMGDADALRREHC